MTNLIKAVKQLGIITADDVQRLTATELLILLIEKLNDMVLHVNDLSVVNDLFEKGLNLNNVYFEKSCINDNLFHYELYMSEHKENTINDLLDLVYHLEG